MSVHLCAGGLENSGHTSFSPVLGLGGQLLHLEFSPEGCLLTGGEYLLARVEASGQCGQKAGPSAKNWQGDYGQQGALPCHP